MTALPSVSDTMAISNDNNSASLASTFNCETFKPPIYKMSQSQYLFYIKFTIVTYKIMPVIGALSIIFNTFNVIVWSRKRNGRLSISYYLIALAISDIGLGYTYFIKGLDYYYLLSNKSYRNIAKTFALLNNVYLPYVFGMSNFWLTVALAVERAVSVAMPTKAR